MFRFSIRDVLWMMVVVGLVVGWRIHMASILNAYDEHRKIVAEREYFEKQRLPPTDLTDHGRPANWFTKRDGVWLAIVIGLIAYNWFPRHKGSMPGPQFIQDRTHQ